MAQYVKELFTPGDESLFTLVSPDFQGTSVFDSGEGAIKLDRTGGFDLCAWGYDNVGSAENFDIAIECRSNTTFSSRQEGLVGRLSNVLGDAIQTSYYAWMRTGSSSVRFYRCPTTTPGIIAEGTLSTSGGRTAYHWQRYRQQGDLAELWQWAGDRADCPAEPLYSVDISTLNTYIPGSHPFGVARHGDTDTSMWVRKIYIGTNGDPAPTSPISSSTPTLGTPTATATTANSISFSIPVTF